MILDGAQKMSHSIDADVMSVEKFHQKLETGYQDVKKGRVQNVAETFTEFREKHK